MNLRTRREAIDGPAGAIECAIDEPMEAVRGIAIVCHPHPQHGGTMENKVVQTLARAFVQRGLRSVRFNFRGIGQSAGTWDEGQGEIDDALAVIDARRELGLPLVLAGFSFGGYVASQAAARLPAPEKPSRMVLVAPATSRFDVATVPEDTLVVHGEADETVPLQATLDWARPQQLPVVVVPGGEHFFHGRLNVLADIVVRYCR